MPCVPTDGITHSVAAISATAAFRVVSQDIIVSLPDVPRPVMPLSCFRHVTADACRNR